MNFKTTTDAQLPALLWSSDKARDVHSDGRSEKTYENYSLNVMPAFHGEQHCRRWLRLDEGSGLLVWRSASGKNDGQWGAV